MSPAAGREPVAARPWVLGAAVAAGSLVVTLLACGGDRLTGPSDPREVEFHPDLGVDLDEMTLHPSGLYYRDVSVGDGLPAADGDTVSVRYRGWLPNGTLFGESDQPITFPLGRGRVIVGWDVGILEMRERGVRLLVLPPDLAYGVRGLPNLVPSGQVVVFRIELVHVAPAG